MVHIDPNKNLGIQRLCHLLILSKYQHLTYYYNSDTGCVGSLIPSSMLCIDTDRLCMVRSNITSIFTLHGCIFGGENLRCGLFTYMQILTSMCKLYALCLEIGRLFLACFSESCAHTLWFLFWLLQIRSLMLNIYFILSGGCHSRHKNTQVTVLHTLANNLPVMCLLVRYVAVSREIFGHNQLRSQCFQVQPVTCWQHVGIYSIHFSVSQCQLRSQCFQVQFFFIELGYIL